MREKKQWRKSINQGELQQTLEQASRKKEVEKQQSAIPDSDLFKVAAKGSSSGSLKKQREKLLETRFKEKERLHSSKYEEVTVKKLVQKKQPVNVPKMSADEDPENEFADLWIDEKANFSTSRNLNQFKNFSGRSRTVVKAVVLPLAGQSINPNAADHKAVIEQVVQEEKRDVEEVQKRLKTLKPYLFKEGEEKKPASIIREGLLTKEGEDLVAESSDGEGDGIEIKNKPVDRKKKKTRTEKNLKLVKRLRRQGQEDERKDKRFNKQINSLPALFKDHQAKEKQIEIGMEERRVKEETEKTLQEQKGLITKSSLIGRYKYKMRKTDFQTEDELAGSLRTARSKGTVADLIVERYDSVFRRNLIEPDMPLGGDKKRARKGKYKWHNSRGGTGAEEMAKQNAEKKSKNEQKKASGQSMLKNDLILI